MRRLTYKLHGCALSTETKACVQLISMALSMAVIAFRGKDKRSTEPCLRFARALQLDFFPLLVQPATGERYASPLLPSYQHFSAMGSDPIETLDHIETRYAARSELRCEKCASRFDEMREAS